jgi:glycine oxidase
MSEMLTAPFERRRGLDVRPRVAVLPQRANIVVIGGGLIGLSVAWRLAEAGRSVVVIERGQVGAGASLAATGMLAPAAEHEPGSDHLLPLALESLNRWPGFRDSLQAASGLDIDYREDGTVVLAVGRDEVERLRFRYELQKRSGVAAEWLSGPQVRAREPLLRPNVTAGILCPLDAQVDPRLVMAALLRACEATGVTIVEERAVEGLDRRGGRVVGVRAGGQTVASDSVILAAGAWSGQVFCRTGSPFRCGRSRGSPWHSARPAAPARCPAWSGPPRCIWRPRAMAGSSSARPWRIAASRRA